MPDGTPISASPARSRVASLPNKPAVGRRPRLRTACASEVVYSAGLDLGNADAAVPIGMSCRLCERADCEQRAFPPIGSHLTVNEHHRSFVPYLFTRRETTRAERPRRMS